MNKTMKIMALLFLCILPLGFCLSCAGSNRFAGSNDSAITSGWNGILWGATIQEIKAKDPNAACFETGCAGIVENNPFSHTPVNSAYMLNKNGRLYGIMMTTDHIGSGEAIARAITSQMGSSNKNMIGELWSRGDIKILTIGNDKKLFTIINESLTD